VKEKITQWQHDLSQISNNLGLGFHVFIILIFIISVISFFYVVKTKRFLIFILCMLVPFSLLAFPVLATVKWFSVRERKPNPKNRNKDNYPFWTFSLPISNGGKVSIPNPFRGIFIAGGAGAGKSRSLIEPLIYQSMERDFTGLLYDYENPVLARHVWAACRSAKTKVKDYYVNFTDLNRSHRLNPLTPEFMTSSSYALEYSGTILANLMPETIGKRKDFWIRNAESLFAAIIWFLREQHPNYCSLPHAVSMALSDDFNNLIEVVSREEESKGMLASIKGGLKSDNQTAGILATIQNALAGINTPEIFWVLSGNDLMLDLNNPLDPKFLTVGNEPSLVDTYSPVISLILSAALKLMNRQGQQHSIFMVDELPTLYVPNLDRIPATARKNQVATVLSVQDYSQLEDKYGDKKAEVVTSVLSNHFFGNTKNPQTAERISRLYGKHDQEFVTESEGKSRGHSRGGVNVLGTHSRGRNFTKSTTIQERHRVKPQDIGNLDKGEFYISIVESGEYDLKVQFVGDERITEEIPAFRDVSNDQVKRNFHKIKSEAMSILEGGDKGSDEIIIDW
jgi:hypothetical protein